MSNFKIADFACKCGCGLNNIELDAITMLQRARSITGIPFIVNSACRCKVHNKSVGGSATSSHLDGLAIDISCDNSIDRLHMIEAFIAVGFNRIGIYKNFIHVDVDSSKPPALFLGKY